MSNLNHICYHIATVTPDYNGDRFPPPLYHQPIAFSLVRVVNSPEIVVQTYTEGLNELTAQHASTLIQSFIKRTASSTLVSYSGKRFCTPVLLLNAVRYGVKMTTLTELLANQVDLEMELSTVNYEAASLSDYSQLIGLAKRPWVDVADAWKNNQVDAVVERLEVDVLITACLFLRLVYCRDDGFDARHYNAVCRAVLDKFRKKSALSERFIKQSNVRVFLQV